MGQGRSYDPVPVPVWEPSAARSAGAISSSAPRARELGSADFERRRSGGDAASCASIARASPFEYDALVLLTDLDLHSQGLHRYGIYS